MYRSVKFLGLLLITGLIFSCSGSKQTAGDSSSLEGDIQLQAKAKELQAKIEEKPANQEYRRQLAVLYKENGHSLEAMKTLEEAMNMDPNDAETKYRYAETALNAGDKAKAYRAYKEVLQGLDGQSYVDRIAPKFADAFKVEAIIGGTGQQAFGAFSADGAKIAYQADPNGNWDIFEYDVATQTRQPLVQSDAQEGNPSYSPDGKILLYTSTVEDHRDVDVEQKLRDIFVMDLSSGRETNLTTNGSDDWHPKYSPDGKFITFVSERSDLREVPFYQLFGNIFVMESDGRFQLELSHTEANNGSPCIAPGSTEDKGIVYFDSNRDGDKAIYRMDFKGQNVRQLTFNPGYQDAGPDISPNGDKIVFFSNRDGNYELYMMNADGSAQQRLTSNASDDLNPVFSPDGQKILFHSNRSGDFDIYLMDLNVQSSSLSASDVVDKIDQAIQAIQ